jgi:hypothetical protein
VAILAVALLGTVALAADPGRMSATGVAPPIVPEAGAAPDMAAGGTPPHVRTGDTGAAAGAAGIGEVGTLRQPAARPGGDHPVAEMLEQYGVPVGGDAIPPSPCRP